MSLRRLVATAAGMAGSAVLLGALTPARAELVLAAREPQALVDAAGPDALITAATAGLAWLAWGWGALGLLLTALSAAPGVIGAVARAVGRVLLPADVRRAAAVALGIGLAAGTPVLSACSTGPAPAAAVQSLPSAAVVPDWPAGPVPGPVDGTPAVDPTPVPDWPGPPGPPSPPSLPDTPGGTGGTGTTDPRPAGHTGEHVVVRGDSLWQIAAADLRARTGREPTPAECAPAVDAWWAANAAVIGPDPDLLLPGQVLTAPASPAVPEESETQP